MREKSRAIDVSNRVGLSFSKGFAKANYNYEKYLQNQIERAIEDWNELKEWINSMLDETGDDKTNKNAYEKIKQKMEDIENR